MSQPSGMLPGRVSGATPASDAAWRIVVDAARRTEALVDRGQPEVFTLAVDGPSPHDAALMPARADDPDATLAWSPGRGWDALLPPDDPRRASIDLYLPVCTATPAQPIVIGHLGQSLDGFIATISGDSQFVTGPENILHLHRMRALSDAIVVGAGTVAADDPQLTTRHVSGSNPVRVVLDPKRRLSERFRVFNDDLVETLYVCGRSLVAQDEVLFGRATIVPVDDMPDGVDVGGVLRLLRDRGCGRIFVEGGGVTVSMFLAANLLDRLHITIAPLIIGNGRPAIRLPPTTALGDCLRPRYRVFRMGGDVLFDCDLSGRPDGGPVEPPDPGPLVTRII